MDGVAFVAILIACLLGAIIFTIVQWFVLEPYTLKHGIGVPETRLVPGFFFAAAAPIGLFIFAWTARADIHWIVPTIGVVIYSTAQFNVSPPRARRSIDQNARNSSNTACDVCRSSGVRSSSTFPPAILVMRPVFSRPTVSPARRRPNKHMSNDRILTTKCALTAFLRSVLACSAVHFAQPLFNNLGVSVGCSVLGVLTAACFFGLLALWYYGAKLRARSKFAEKY